MGESAHEVDLGLEDSNGAACHVLPTGLVCLDVSHFDSHQVTSFGVDSEVDGTKGATTQCLTPAPQDCSTRCACVRGLRNIARCHRVLLFHSNVQAHFVPYQLLSVGVLGQRQATSGAEVIALGCIGDRSVVGPHLQVDGPGLVNVHHCLRRRLCHREEVAQVRGSVHVRKGAVREGAGAGVLVPAGPFARHEPGETLRPGISKGSDSDVLQPALALKVNDGLGRQQERAHEMETQVGFREAVDL
mmetsp:Transcript_20306/g.47444  ORF Transcript_20306/g.47444 Transcript_20306/m.47444 type:complete len:245 (-) Transcript_20306:1214-1948(-)